MIAFGARRLASSSWAWTLASHSILHASYSATNNSHAPAATVNPAADLTTIADLLGSSTKSAAAMHTAIAMTARSHPNTCPLYNLATLTMYSRGRLNMLRGYHSM